MKAPTTLLKLKKESYFKVKREEQLIGLELHKRESENKEFDALHYITLHGRNTSIHTLLN
jgi:hypothetical protein